MRIDVHQHIWTAPLLAALERRRRLPLVRHSEGLTVLHSAGERPYVIDVEGEAPARRAQLVREDGLDLAVIALSSPLGIEALEADLALELIDAYLDGIVSLPAKFAAWGPIALQDPGTDQVDILLERGCVGISLPAGALADHERLDSLGHVLERVAARGVPLFIHPGPGMGAPLPEAPLGEPLWWRGLTDYVAQMQAAWLTFVSLGRREHPHLVVVFAMLAGCAPLHAERLAARGGPTIDLLDPGLFYETSSYGPAALDMMSLQVGDGQLVYGSDRPVVDPCVTGRELALQANAESLFSRVGVTL